MTTDTKYPNAVVREVDGQLVLDDPVAVAVFRAVEKHNLAGLLEANTERIVHFSQRLYALGRSPGDTVIVILAVDDSNGRAIADILMPGHNWQAYRDRGEVPVARGLAERKGIEATLAIFDPEAATKLRETDDGIAVVVVDRGVAEVFPV